MKVFELIEELQHMTPDSEVVIQDEDGNNHSLVGIEESKFFSEETGDFFEDEETPEIDTTDFETVVILWSEK